MQLPFLPLLLSKFLLNNSARIAVISLLLLFMGCDHKPEKPVNHLKSLIDNKKQSEALLESIAALEVENRKNAILLSGFSNTNRILKRSIQGESITWSDGPLLFYWYNDKFEKIELSFQPVNINISHQGRHIILVESQKSGCTLSVVSLKDKRVIPLNLGTSCSAQPAITDGGKKIYRIYKNKLYVNSLSEQGSTRELAALTTKVIKAKYSKIDNSYFLYDLPGETLLLLYGAAGYYQSYYLRSNSSKLLDLKSGLTTPTLFGTGNSFPPATELESSTQKRGGGSKFRAYIYSGGAGDLSLQRLSITSSRNPQLNQAYRKFPASRSLVYLQESKEFLSLRKKILNLYNTEKKSFQRLPLHLEKFELFSEGIVYEDSEHRLYFRRSPFSATENELLQLYQQALELKPENKKKRKS